MDLCTKNDGFCNTKEYIPQDVSTAKSVKSWLFEDSPTTTWDQQNHIMQTYSKTNNDELSTNQISTTHDEFSTKNAKFRGADVPCCRACVPGSVSSGTPFDYFDKTILFFSMKSSFVVWNDGSVASVTPRLRCVQGRWRWNRRETSLPVRGTCKPGGGRREKRGI